MKKVVGMKSSFTIQSLVTTCVILAVVLPHIVTVSRRDKLVNISIKGWSLLLVVHMEILNHAFLKSSFYVLLPPASL